MAGYKETPRQKMIGMMYLVLTALLALNVSKDIINAFVTVNESMVTTNENFDRKLFETYSKFESQVAIAGPNAQEWHDKAMTAKNLSDSLVGFINKMKSELLVMSDRKIKTLAEADTANLKHIGGKDNYDDPTRYFLGTDVSKGKSEEMIARFQDFREKMSNLVKPEDRDRLNLGLNTDGEFRDEYGKMQDWANHYFFRTLLAADIVILNKFIAEIRNAQFDVVTRLYSYIGATDFKFNKIAAKVIPTRSYIFRGEEFKAEILVAAYDTTVQPDVKYRMGLEKWSAGMEAGANSVAGERGTAMLKIGTGGMDYGPKKYAGVINIVNPMGIAEAYPFNGEFVVQEPMAVVSPDKMSVFYRGLENPVSVSVPGITPENIEARMVGGQAVMTRVGSGKYIIKPSEMGGITIEVLARIDNTLKPMGTRAFRVMPVPPPTAAVGGKEAGRTISLNDLSRAQVVAVLKDFLFDDVRYHVVRFTVSATVGAFYKSVTVQGNTMNDEARSLVSKLGGGQMILFENITVKGPDGREQPISPVNLKTL
ncbi:MAG: gliding motility protein GldM [Bacteroidales bacterium]|nr:gliding motility protein GldM [Bacteroidales bacterium]